MLNETVETRTLTEPAALEKAIARAFLTAHLLTGSRENGENAVLEAIDAWDGQKQDEDELFEHVVSASVRGRGTAGADHGDVSLLPAELRAVVSLPRHLRHCFVLRTLAGLSQAECARMLRLHPLFVGQCTCAAMKRLPSLAEEATSGSPYLAWKLRIEWAD